MTPVTLALLCGVLIGVALLALVLLCASWFADWRADRRIMRRGAPIEITARVLLRRQRAVNDGYARQRRAVEKRWKS